MICETFLRDKLVRESSKRAPASSRKNNLPYVGQKKAGALQTASRKLILEKKLLKKPVIKSHLRPNMRQNRSHSCSIKFRGGGWRFEAKKPSCEKNHRFRKTSKIQNIFSQIKHDARQILRDDKFFPSFL